MNQQEGLWDRGCFRFCTRLRRKLKTFRHATEKMGDSKLIRSTSNECRLYIGNLPQDVRNRDVEDIFYKFGRISAVDVHNRYSPAFAFVEFEDPR